MSYMDPLFGAIKRGRRAYLQREALASVDGVTVLFTGPRLDQADLGFGEQWNQKPT